VVGFVVVGNRDVKAIVGVDAERLNLLEFRD